MLAMMGFVAVSVTMGVFITMIGVSSDQLELCR